MSEGKKEKTSIAYLAFFLLMVCAAAAAVMGIASYATKDPIEKNKNKALENALRIVLPEFERTEIKEVTSEDGIPSTVYKALDGNSEVVGYAVKTSTLKGYGGKMEGLLSFSADGKIIKYIILTHGETPGIGTKLTDRVRKRTITDVIKGREPALGLPPNEYLDSYEGVSASGAESLASDRRHFKTGATVSSKAVLDLAERACGIMKGVTE